MADTEEYEPYETVPEFLKAKGSVGLLALLYEKPRTYSELESEIEITSSTISRRRIDADHLGLLTLELKSDENGTKHVYTLTETGEYLTGEMAHKGITSSYHKMRDHQETIEKKTEEVVDWVKQNPEMLFSSAGIHDHVEPREDTEIPPGLEEIRAAREENDEGTDASEEETDTGDDEDSDAGDANIQAETDSDSSDLPSDPDYVRGASETDMQGTLDDVFIDETESGQTDDESDS